MPGQSFYNKTSALCMKYYNDRHNKEKYSANKSLFIELLNYEKDQTCLHLAINTVSPFKPYSNIPIK